MREFLANNYVYFILLAVVVCCIVGINIVFADSLADVPPPKQKYSEETVCVEPVEVMRKKHFDFVLDHRDKTVIDGIRTKKHSLIECIECHITANAQGDYARYSQETHFCASCHQYAAVTIDCFQCHADRPEEAIRKAMNPNQTVGLTDEKKINSYLHFSEVERQ